MRGQVLLLLGFLVLLSLVISGCPKKTLPPPPIVPPKEEPAPAPVIEPKVEPVKPKPTLKSVYFDFDKYDLTAEAKAILSDNAKILMDNPDIRVRLEGNCDERGTNAYNMSLGDKRANAVKNFLIQYGISPKRLETVSYGEERPVCREHNEDCWWRNRRVDLIIIP